MAQKELPITLEEQIDMMKKCVSFRQRIRMRRLHCISLMLIGGEYLFFIAIVSKCDLRVQYSMLVR